MDTHAAYYLLIIVIPLFSLLLVHDNFPARCIPVHTRHTCMAYTRKLRYYIRELDICIRRLLECHGHNSDLDSTVCHSARGANKSDQSLDIQHGIHTHISSPCLTSPHLTTVEYLSRPFFSAIFSRLTPSNDFSQCPTFSLELRYVMPCLFGIRMDIYVSSFSTPLVWWSSTDGVDER
ncbi:hypothetical protein EV127DRAFT_436469 [Xylaria flabelliformis]|nr:hypothetical protein EV127DRAFT_436469 [Xylaria flabelliformis]